MAIKKDGVGNDRLTFRAQAFQPGGCDCDTPGYEDEVGNDNVVDLSCSDSVKVLRTLPMELTDEERDMVKGYLKISDITRAYIAANGHLFIVMNDGTERDVGDARGVPGDTPEFGDNGNWFIGGKDTGVPTTGPQGDAPYIGENGNWWVSGKDLGIRTGKPKLGDIMESLQHPGAGWVACDDGIEAPGTPLYDVLPYNTEWRKVPTEKAGLPQAAAFKPLPVAGQWYYMQKYTGSGSYGQEAFVYDANTDTFVTFSCPSVSSAEKSYGMTGLTHDGDRYVLCVAEMQISASMTGVTHFFTSTNLEDWEYQASFNARSSGYFATDLCFDGTYLLVIEHYGYGEQQEYVVRFDKALSTRTEISGIGTDSNDFIELPPGYWSYATTDAKYVNVRGSGSITSKFIFSSSYNLGRVAFFNDRYWFGLPVADTTSTHVQVADLTTNEVKSLSVTTLTSGVADRLYGAEYDPNTNEWTLYTEYGVGSRYCVVVISADADPTNTSNYKATPVSAFHATWSYEQMKPDRSQMRLSSDSYRLLRDPNLKYRPKSGDNPHYIYAGVGGEAIVAPSMYAVDADAVHYYSDDVTDAQRTRARENIGAASVTELNTLREDVDQRIANVPKFSTLVVESLPIRDVSDTTVYLVPTGDGEDLYTEYINVDGKWEKLGTQSVLSVPGEKGDDGITPHIGENGNWWLGETDTGVKATGEDGITPHIGENGNWYIGEEDTGVFARNEDVSLYADDMYTSGILEKGAMELKILEPSGSNVIRYEIESAVVYIKGVRRARGGFTTSTQAVSFERLMANILRLNVEKGTFSWRVAEVTRDGDSLVNIDNGESYPARSGGYYDLIPYLVRVPAGATAITYDMVEDLRADERYCGYVRDRLAPSKVSELENDAGYVTEEELASGANGIIDTATGELIALTDSAEAPLSRLVVYGKSTQDGTPTPDAPVPIVSVGEDGTTKVCLYGKNLFLPMTLGTQNEVTLSKQDDYYVLNGTPNASGNFVATGDLPAGRYTLSANNPSHNGLSNYAALIQVYSPKTLNSIIAEDNKSNSTDTKTIKAGNYEFRVRYQAGVTYDNFIIKPQLEIGEVATEYEPATPQTLFVPYTLCGIPVTSGGNYTDASGQQWVCDEVDFVRGVRVQRIKKTSFVADRYGTTTGADGTVGYLQKATSKDKKQTVNNGILSAVAKYIVNNNASLRKPATIAENANNLVLFGEPTDTEESMRAKYDNTELYYVLAEPIETPLTEEELAAYRALQTNYPNTTIYADDNAGLSVGYSADTKLYIDKKLDENEVDDDGGGVTETPDVPVQSVNGKTGAVQLSASDVGASPTGHTHSKSEITDFPTSMTPTSHNQAASTITAGTLAGKVQANASAAETVTTAQVRDIYAGTDDMTAGTSALASGTLYLVYE